MKKSFLLFALVAALAVRVHAQNWATVTATNITDLNQQKLAAGQLCFLATDQNDNPISFGAGGGGQVLKRAFCSLISTGAVTAFTVPNPAQTTPAGIFYRVTVKDSSSGLEVLHYTQVTFSGATFNFDNYAPLNAGSFAPPAGTAVSGNLSVNGNLSVTGTFSAGLLGASGLGINGAAANTNAVNGPSGWTVQAGGTPEITVNSAGVSINAPSFIGNVSMPATASATSSANFGTALESWNSSFWNGTAPVADTWTAQSFLPAGTNPANSFLIFNHTGTPGSFFQINSNLQLPNTTAATSSSNVNSPTFTMLGDYWTGSASNTDTWGLQGILGTGVNPSSTLSITHAGSTGATTIDLSSVGTLKTGALNVGASDTGLSRAAAGVVAAGNGTAGNSSGTFEARKLQLDGSTSGNTVLQSAAAAS